MIVCMTAYAFSEFLIPNPMFSSQSFHIFSAILQIQIFINLTCIKRRKLPQFYLQETYRSDSDISMTNPEIKSFIEQECGQFRHEAIQHFAF